MGVLVWYTKQGFYVLEPPWPPRFKYIAAPTLRSLIHHQFYNSGPCRGSTVVRQVEPAVATYPILRHMYLMIKEVNNFLSRLFYTNPEDQSSVSTTTVVHVTIFVKPQPHQTLTRGQTIVSGERKTKHFLLQFREKKEALEIFPAQLSRGEREVNLLCPNLEKRK